MIFYTLQGPSETLEIHDTKLVVFKKGLKSFFSKEEQIEVFPLEELLNFEIKASKFIFPGKIEWISRDGSVKTFRYNTNHEMVKKIERYMQKRTEKNHSTFIQKAT
jgi:hypothetical protein